MLRVLGCVAVAASLLSAPAGAGSHRLSSNVLSGWLPHCKRRYDGLAVVGSSLVFGLFVQQHKGLLALMG